MQFTPPAPTLCSQAPTPPADNAPHPRLHTCLHADPLCSPPQAVLAPTDSGPPGPRQWAVRDAGLLSARADSAGFRVAAGIGLGPFWCGGLFDRPSGFRRSLAASGPRRNTVRQARRRGLPDLSRCASAVGRAGRPRIQTQCRRSTIAEGRGHGRRASTTNLLNPKIAVFYTGLLPQLVSGQGGPTGTVACAAGAHPRSDHHRVGSVATWSLLSRARSTFEKPRVRQALERITGNSFF